MKKIILEIGSKQIDITKDIQNIDFEKLIFNIGIKSINTENGDFCSSRVFSGLHKDFEKKETQFIFFNEMNVLDF